jgi:hypothetical protein
MSALSLRGGMLETLRGYWRDAAGYQKFAYIVAALLIASGIFHFIVLLVSGDSLSGDVSFRKPTTFGLSFGLTLATAAWFLTFFAKNRILGWSTMGLLAVPIVYEVFAVTLQRWRGVASHFNNATPFDIAIFDYMGQAVGLIGVVIVGLAVWSFFPMRAAPGLTWAIRLGMLLLIVAQLFGALIVVNGVTLIAEGSAGPFNIFGEAGVMKLPHFFAMHAVQVLPVLAWLLGFSRWPKRRVVVLVVVATAGYMALLGATVVQTFSGLAPLALTTVSIILFVAGLLVLIGSGVTMLGVLARGARPAAA